MDAGSVTIITLLNETTKSEYIGALFINIRRIQTVIKEKTYVKETLFINNFQFFLILILW